MHCNRRDFLTGHWAKETMSAVDEMPDRNEQPPSEPLRELPSDFSPALLRMQARILGLNVDTMTDEEAAEAVLAVLNEQKPS